MALNDKILNKKRSKSWLKNKNLSFEKSGQKPGQSQKSCRTTHTSPKMRACPGKSGRMVTLTRPYIVCMPNLNQLKQHLSHLGRFIFFIAPRVENRSFNPLYRYWKSDFQRRRYEIVYYITRGETERLHESEVCCPRETKAAITRNAFVVFCFE